MKRLILLILLILSALLLFPATKISIYGDYNRKYPNEDLLTLDGNAFIKKGNEIEIYTDHATITGNNGDYHTVDASGNTFVVFESGSATSNYLNYDLDTSKGTLNHVSKVLLNKNGNNIKMSNISTLDIDSNDKIYIGTRSQDQQVYIEYKDDLNINSDYFEYYENEQKLYLKGNIYLNDLKNNRIIMGDELNYFLDDDSFNGKQITVQINL
ncbi:MAG: hypothetical protein PWQ77_899 [Kosmotogales bacterium]|nr:hypothetical protein [Kosmotogales bacterium]